MNVGAVLPGNYTGTKTIIPLPTSNTINFVGGVQVYITPDGQWLVIIDQSSSPPMVYVYCLTSGPSLTLMQSVPLSNASDPVSFAFAPGFHLILTADAGLVAGVVYPFPAGGSGTAYPVPGALPIGAAINPTAQFLYQHR
jgi:hypothetical protein